MITPLDIIGLFGISFTVVNYALLQWRREYAKELPYSAGNLLGSLLLGASLMERWNLAAFVVTSIMGLISLYGVYRCTKYQVRARQIENMLKTRL